MNPTVAKIVTDYLKVNSFDGLFNSDADCACRLADLCPCVEGYLACEAGYFTDCECPDHYGWHIQREKPTEAKQ